MAVNEVTGVKEVIEVTVVDGEKNTDANGGVESIEESLENLHTPTKEQAVMRSELAETFAEKVKKGMSGESTGASVGGKALRPSLPRVSKTNHRVIPDVMMLVTNASSPKAHSRDNRIPQLFNVWSLAINRTQRSGLKSGTQRQLDVAAPPRTVDRRAPPVDNSLGADLDT
ncbi:hypothetical protein YC2023_022664 [Brassica napus]